MTTASDLLRAGDLAGLQTHLSGQVRAEPANAAHRLALAEALIVRGDLERADAQLELAATQDGSVALPVALARQLVRAAIAREDCFTARRPPDLVAEADAAITAALARLAGEAAEVDDVPLAGTIDGRPFAGWRDADDRTPQVLELLTSTGKYVWVSFAQVVSLKPRPPARARDLVWREAELEVRGGPTGMVYLPAIYQAGTMTDAQRLGRETDWIEGEGATVGLGLRTWLVGDEAVSLNDVAELRVEG